MIIAGRIKKINICDFFCIGASSRRTRDLSAALLALFVSACGSLDPGESPLQPEEGDRAKLVEMRREISALIGDAECEATEACRQVGIGAKPCGGPWEYLIYSVADSAALADRLVGYNGFEADMNRRYGYSSDCSVPNEPIPGCDAGRCVDLLQLSDDRGSIRITPDQIDAAPPASLGLPRFAADLDLESDEFAVQDARVEGDILTLVVGYSGGCEVHQFTLLVSLAATRSIPPQHGLKLVHESNGDACEAFITSELHFDLSPLKSRYSDLGGVAFRLEGVEGFLNYVF